ncbi:MAG TPA: heme o synthase [Gemmatimonadales bacterium]
MTVAVAPRHAALADFVELGKPRIVWLVMVTAAAGFWLAGPSASDLYALFHLLVGTALVATGTNALNQVYERDTDALMHRTRTRPLPDGRLPLAQALAFGWITGIGGVAYLFQLVNPLTGALALLTLGSYVLIYTPLKRRTTLATLIGAVPGALPIVGGWTAVQGTVTLHAAVLFSILFLWQLPHFLALAWLYREDYGRAGLRMISVDDADGRATFGYASLYAAALLPMSLLPTMLGVAGRTYFVGALTLSAVMLVLSVQAMRRATVGHARRLFRWSLAYLPLLLALMSVNRAA